MTVDDRTAAWELRDATEGDAEAVALIYNESIMPGTATMDEGEKTAADIVGWLRGFHEREALLVLEHETGQIDGWGIIKRYSERRGYRYAGETAVYLRHTVVRRGLGTKIKLGLIDKCRELGYHHLVAKIFADNEGSIAYNLSLGYERVGIQREIGWKNGHWQDIAILQLVLDDRPAPRDTLDD